jgi:flagellar hook-basal body complex protein FliE
MTQIPTVVITPSSPANGFIPGAASVAGDNSVTSFSDAMSDALSEAERAGYVADAQAIKAISGTGSLTEVVTALSHAELTLQTLTTIRDRVVQAFQDVMKMPI